MRSFRGFLVVIVAFTCAGGAGAADFFWSQTGGGPEGGYLYDVEVVPPGGSTIYLAAEEGGVFRSIDGGRVWSKSGLHGIPIRTVAVDPNQTSTLFAGAWDGMLYRSQDGGASWVERHQGLSSSAVMDMEVHRNDSSMILLGTYGSGIYRSEDGGESWMDSDAGLSDGQVNRVRQDPNDPDVWYAGVYNDSDPLNKSTDGGLTWFSISGDIATGTCRDIEIFPGDSDIIYVAIEGHYIWKTLDGGVIWEEQDSFHGFEDAYLYTVRVHPTDPDIAWAGTRYHGVYKTTDGGTTWIDVDEEFDPFTRLIMTHPVDPDRLYMATIDGNGMYESDDGGDTWTEINKGLTNIMVQCLDIHPTTQNLLFAGTQNRGIFRSVDYGRTWEERNVQLPTRNIYCLDSVELDVYAGASEGIFRALDGGNIWAELTVGIDYSDNIYDIEIDPGNPAKVYLGSESMDDGGTYRGGVYVTTNRGESWTAYDIDPGVDYAVDVDDIHLAGGSTLYAATDYGVYRSGNGGMSWTDLPSMTHVCHSVVTDPRTPGTVYAGTNEGLYRSLDSGDTWELMVEFIVARELHADSSRNPTWIYAGGEGGIFVSDDLGVNWATCNAGLTNRHVQAMVIDPYDPDILYAGTTGSGVFGTADYIPPDPPGDLTAIPLDRGARLNWTLGDENDLAGYLVYYDTDGPGAPYSGHGASAGASPVDVGKEGALDLIGLANHQDLYLAVSAYDELGNESGWSTELMVEPNPQPMVVMAGYGSTYLTTSGGTLSMIGWAMDLEGDDVTGMELAYAGLPLGIDLNPMGGSPGVFQLNLPVTGPVPVLREVLELVAHDETGAPSALWPYLSVRQEAWGDVVTGTYRPEEPVIQDWWLLRDQSLEIGAGPGGPFVYAAGWNLGRLSVADGGTMNLVAVPLDPDDAITRVELFYQGMGTGVLLKDNGLSGDFATGDGIYGFEAVVSPGSVPAGDLLLEVRATNDVGETSDLWPYLVVH